MSEPQQPVAVRGLVPPMGPRNPLRDIGDILLGRCRSCEHLQAQLIAVEAERDALLAASKEGIETLHRMISERPEFRKTMASIAAMLARTEVEPEAVQLRAMLDGVTALYRQERANHRPKRGFLAEAVFDEGRKECGECPKCISNLVCWKADRTMWCTACLHEWHVPPEPFQVAIDYDAETEARLQAAMSSGQPPIATAETAQ